MKLNIKLELKFDSQANGKMWCFGLYNYKIYTCWTAACAFCICHCCHQICTAQWNSLCVNKYIVVTLLLVFLGNRLLHHSKCFNLKCVYEPSSGFLPKTPSWIAVDMMLNLTTPQTVSMELQSYFHYLYSSWDSNPNTFLKVALLSCNIAL